jgi:hypothetical protein
MSSLLKMLVTCFSAADGIARASSNRPAMMFEEREVVEKAADLQAQGLAPASRGRLTAFHGTSL